MSWNFALKCPQLNIRPRFWAKNFDFSPENFSKSPIKWVFDIFSFVCVFLVKMAFFGSIDSVQHMWLLSSQVRFLMFSKINFYVFVRFRSRTSNLENSDVFRFNFQIESKIDTMEHMGSDCHMTNPENNFFRTFEIEFS